MKRRLPIHAAAPVLARWTPPAPAFDGLAAAPEWIMWMPAGTHEITAMQGGAPITLRVLVDRATAHAVQAAFTAHRGASPQRPYFDFDHAAQAAAAWPEEFAWRDAEAGRPAGVYVRVTWSDRGRAAVTGREYRAFSPSFFVDEADPARVTGTPLDMGGLVNNPAFRAIEPLFAAAPNPHPRTMKKLQALLACLAAIHSLRQERATLAADASKADALRAKDNEIEAKLTEAQGLHDAVPAELQAIAAGAERDAAAVQARDAELQLLRLRNERLEAAAAAQRKAAAKAAVEAAVARGALAPQATEIHAQWQAQIEASPGAAALLAALPGQAALGGSVIQAAAPRVEVLAVDTNDALQGYLAAATPLERGQIYRRELDPILAKGERIAFERFRPGAGAVHAANTLGTLVGNIISQRTLALIYSKRPMLNGILTDFSAEPLRLGQSVYTRTVGLPTVQNFGGTVSETADTDYTTAMNQHKEVRYTYTATEYNSTGRNLVAEHSEALAVALGNHLVDAVAALITDAFTAETTGAAATKDYSSLVAVAKALNVAGVPDFRRFGWVNADVAEALRNDELVLANLDRNTTAAYATWRNVIGFENLWEFPALPGNSVNLIAFFGFPDALLLVSRVVVNPESVVGVGYPGRLQTVTDPVTGLSVVSNQWIGQSDLAINDRLILAYGCSRGNVTCGHKWVTS